MDSGEVEVKQEHVIRASPEYVAEGSILWYLVGVASAVVASGLAVITALR